MKKLLTIFICMIALLIPATVFANTRSIECTASVNGQEGHISGRITNVTGNHYVTLLVGDPDNLLYINQVTSADDGSFDFEFCFQDHVRSGSYNFKIGTNAGTGTYSGVINYTAPIEIVQNKFIDVDVTVTISGYVPTISGTVYCTEGKTIHVDVLNKTDNVVIADETITAEDGVFDISYTLPSLLNPKGYELAVSCVGDDNELMNIDATIDSSILLLDVGGAITTADNVEIDLQVQTVNTNLIDKDTTITGNKVLATTIPNIVANSSIHICAQGYETVVIYDTTEEENGNIENAIKISADTVIQSSINGIGESVWFKISPKYSGRYVITVSEGYEVALYERSLDGIESVQISAENTLIYPKEYYLQVSSSGAGGTFNLDISSVGTKRNTKAFEMGTYYSDLADGGKLYQNENQVGAEKNTDAVSWLCNFNGILYFNANGRMYKLSDIGFAEVGDMIDAKYIISDADGIYFSNWSDCGRLYRGVVSEEGSLILSKVCDDSASWIFVQDNYLYYRNILDQNKWYYIEKTATNAQSGQAIE